MNTIMALHNIKGYYLLGNNDSYEGGKSLSAARTSVPLESGGAEAMMAIVSKFGTGCISEECG